MDYLKKLADTEDKRTNYFEESINGEYNFNLSFQRRNF